MKSPDIGQARYVERGFGVLGRANVDSLLGAVSIQKVAGSATSRFYDWFKDRTTLLRALRQDATRLPSEHAAATNIKDVVALGRMINGLKDKNPGALEAMKALFAVPFDAASDPQSEQYPQQLLRLLMGAVAPSDAEAKQELAGFNEDKLAVDTRLYGIILAAIERQPISAIGSVENFTIIITALVDGLLNQARITDVTEMRELLESALIPVIYGITMPQNGEPLTEAGMMYA